MLKIYTVLHISENLTHGATVSVFIDFESALEYARDLIGTVTLEFKKQQDEYFVFGDVEYCIIDRFMKYSTPEIERASR